MSSRPASTPCSLRPPRPSAATTGCGRWGRSPPSKRVDYLVVSHTEPDHSGSIERLLDLNPRLKIVATGCALGFLKEIVNKDFYSIAIKDGQTLELDGKTLEFIVVPNLHWPEHHVHLHPGGQDPGSPATPSAPTTPMDEVVASKVTDREGYLRATKYYFDLHHRALQALYARRPQAGAPAGAGHDLPRPRPGAGLQHPLDAGPPTRSGPPSSTPTPGPLSSSPTSAPTATPASWPRPIAQGVKGERRHRRAHL